MPVYQHFGLQPCGVYPVTGEVGLGPACDLEGPDHSPPLRCRARGRRSRTTLRIIEDELNDGTL
jgi:hypothetical protein